jgi:hypothetical protein
MDRDGSEVVRAGAQPLLDQLPAQVLEPARVGGCEYDFAQLSHRRGSLSLSISFAMVFSDSSRVWPMDAQPLMIRPSWPSSTQRSDIRRA